MAGRFGGTIPLRRVVLATQFPSNPVRSCPEGFLLYRKFGGIFYIIKNKPIHMNRLYSAPPGARTLDTLIKSQVLYQLS